MTYTKRQTSTISNDKGSVSVQTITRNAREDRKALHSVAHNKPDSNGNRGKREGGDKSAFIEMAEIRSALDASNMPVPDVAVPDHVWTALQMAGEAAAVRLAEILRSPKFTMYPPAAQKSLIELALTRAYGATTRKTVKVTLSSNGNDAIATSLAGMVDLLPEMMRNVTPEQPGD